MFPQLGEKREERKKMGPLVLTEDKNSHGKSTDPEGNAKENIIHRFRLRLLQILHVAATICPGVGIATFRVGWGRAWSGVLPVEEEIPASG